MLPGQRLRGRWAPLVLSSSDRHPWRTKPTPAPSARAGVCFSAAHSTGRSPRPLPFQSPSPDPPRQPTAPWPVHTPCGVPQAWPSAPHRAHAPGALCHDQQPTGECVLIPLSIPHTAGALGLSICLPQGLTGPTASCKLSSASQICWLFQGWSVSQGRMRTPPPQLPGGAVPPYFIHLETERPFLLRSSFPCCSRPHRPQMA